MIDRLRELFLRDFWLKLFSLALALLIWFTIFQAIQQQGSPVAPMGEKLKERTFYNLPVTKVSSGSDISNFRILPDEVQVTVQGEAKNVDSLQLEDIKARVDLSDADADKSKRRTVEVSMPAGLTYVRIDPAEVDVIVPPKLATPAKQ